ncbi:Rap1a/Tai family immunity protein [Ferrimonas senticii]|uniref:Rap1a/Tai family immunity protein n=1 Tax=Ferrimonas senticii TaxID=394566 RepID=UPI00042928B3|nr:Rap1a/Tai family immunity protein [Ferrimonas senticii]
MKTLALALTASAMMMAPTSDAVAVNSLTAQQLAEHCAYYPNDTDSLHGEFCARYIQGFVDGAAAADDRVLRSMEAESNRSSFADRALRTRTRYTAASRYAEFCFGQPVPLQQVVLTVATDLTSQGNISGSARDAVYQSLKTHFPCR